MSVLDTWDNLYNKRLEWAYNGKDKFVDSLISEDASNLVNMQTGDEKIVSVFGKPQVGKTTLILNLIGIKQSFIAELSSTLKGSRKTGESSTSTAVLYSISDNQNFIINKRGTKIECEIENEVSVLIDEIRLEIERTPSLINNYIEIKIPIRYFESRQNKEFSQVKIVDLPGYGSTSHDEHKHVEDIIEKFISKSSLILIVESSNNLINVNTLKFITSKYFGFNSNMHRVVLTHSVSARSTKKAISEMSSIDKSAYLSIFNREIDVNIINPGLKNIKFYPLEYGKSWNQLIEYDVEIHNMVSPIMEALFKDLRMDIVNSTNKYNQLVKYTGMAKSLEEIKLSRISSSNELLEKNENRKSKYERKRDSLLSMKEKKLSFVKELKVQLKNKPSFAFMFTVKNMPSEKSRTKLIEFIESEKKRFVDTVMKYVVNYIDEVDNFHFPECKNEINKKFDVHTSELTNRLKMHLSDKYIFFAENKWKKDVDECKKVLELSVNKSKDYFEKDLEKKIKDHNSKIKQKIESDDAFIKRINIRLKKIEQLINSLNRSIENEKNELIRINSTYDKDIMNFKRFFRFIEDSFHEEVFNTINSINNKQTEATKKCLMCGYLKIIIEEFEKLEACR